ncbi:MAG: hypothetical protein LBD57_04560 [Endomicrobium sp.]|uniref:hypothetical protein n=1 Tax=Candidatus Endomicrobiellum cubanum TaxID=3242325 RepID=UPI002816B3D1|nr:hypothetical protein [Endomicrobium sp.]
MIKRGRKKILEPIPKFERRPPPSPTPEGRENQMIALAVDRAEEQIRSGNVSAQVLTHYLKLGSTKERLEKEILEKQKELITAKTEAIQSAKKVEELYTNALKAMRAYSGGAFDTTDEL